jgi:hypothetical protein
VNLSTNQGSINLGLLIAALNSNSQIVVNTTQTGAIAGYTVNVNNITWDNTVCASYPNSGTITFVKSGKTTTATFTNACDGSYICTQN